MLDKSRVQPRGFPAIVKQHDYWTAKLLLHVHTNSTNPTHEVAPFSVIDVEHF
jgi:hypothetical protein